MLIKHQFVKAALDQYLLNIFPLHLRLLVELLLKYHRLNDFLDEITKVVFGGISNELDLSPYQL